jgi:fluoride ion exporter CrcB/FEX
MQQFFIVGIGSFLGGGIRYLISVFFNQKINPHRQQGKKEVLKEPWFLLLER